ncbi:MAG: HAMP domain-containing protein [Myxococcota bacterium]|jgi:adenylate cyclase|nr:HAMP domain-containing protein [Myxococcota bacterium]
MPKFLHSVQFKLTLAFVLLLSFVAGGSLLITARAASKALREILSSELLAVASIAATQIDGDALEGLQAGMEDTPQFRALLTQLDAMRRAHPDMKYVYTMRRDGDAIRFVVDADYGNKADPGAGIDELYEERPPEMLEGFERPSVDSDIAQDKWGATLSGYAPVKNRDGRMVALVGIDMSAQRVEEKEAFIDRAIFLVLGGGLVLAALIVLVFSRTMIRDVRKLNAVATAISMGNMDASIDVERKDEIGELAQSFGRMLASLKLMMMDSRDIAGVPREKGPAE